MDEESVVITLKLRKLAMLLNTLEAVQGQYDLPRLQAKPVTAMQHSVVMARRLANEAADSELGVKNPLLTKSAHQLDIFRTNLLKASEYNLVSAIDVAQLGAMSDEIIGLIKA